MTTTSTLRNPARIAVVDDHGIVRFGYAQLINQEPALDVCGMAATEQEGLQMLRDQRPDLAIIDLSLDEGDGLDLIKSVISIIPEMKILVISAHDENLFAHRVLAAGALGFITKRKAPEKLIDGIQALLRGDFFSVKRSPRR
ncbi:response regulator [Roseimaritima ulvae]|uniref:Oxygen regulatory protein NreC n=1 Tax=Roseimaritima ulvae TaxID=980254 RepID=A0A5B9QIT2_9BACT|nr:response regulator transcription factor [Roseimaritima ulvae]QEG38814.1 Oxygen regulatory protein NreC [Roseimaritima ulvae]